MAIRAHCMAVARDPTSGASLLSATVNVYNPGTVVAISATIFDKNGNTLSNPLTSDPVTGLIDFYLNVAQEVDLVVAKAGFTTRTYSNVPVIDDASFDLTALLTTTGDIAYASSANTPARLAIGGANTLLHGGATPAYSAVASGDLNLSTASNILGSDVLLNNVASYFDGPSMAQGSSGTWFVVGSVVLYDTAGSANFKVKLWDGTTVIASAYVASVGGSQRVQVALMGFITTPAGNIRISVNDSTATTGHMAFNDSGNSKDSVVYGIRIG